MMHLDITDRAGKVGFSPSPHRTFSLSRELNPRLRQRKALTRPELSLSFLLLPQPELTTTFLQRLSQIMEKDANPNLALRVQVESGGCHGFQYLMSLTTLPDPASPDWASVVREDDTIFQYVPDADQASAPKAPTPGAPKVVLDLPSLELLKDSKVDFTVELIGSEFKITDNPHATSACGCGTSFDIKL